MDFLAELILILIVAKLFGELLERGGLPSVIGEIGAGIFLGPALLGLVTFDPTIELFSDIGIIALLFISGAGMDSRSFMKLKGAAALTAVSGVVIPFLSGILIGWIFHLPTLATIFIAITFSITSIGISVRTLIDQKQLNTPVGTAIVSTALLDDVIGIFLLAILTSLAAQDEFVPDSMLIPILVSVVFLILFVTVGKRLLVWLFELTRKTETHEMIYSVAIIIGLASAWLAHTAGLHYSIGAFISGFILGDQIRKDRVLYDGLMEFSFGFFVTIFFASIGLLFTPEWGELLSPYLIPIIVMAVIGKILGGYIGSRPFMKKNESLIIGIGLCPRGEIALVVAKVSLVGGIISAGLYSSVMLMVIVTILITPLLMKAAFSYSGQKT